MSQTEIASRAFALKLAGQVRGDGRVRGMTGAELARAAEILEQLRQVFDPALPEFVRDGQQLADLLGVSRAKAWQITKREDFRAAAPAIQLGRKLRMRPTRQILAWVEMQKENPGASSDAGASAPSAALPSAAMSTNNQDHIYDSAKPRRRQARRR